MCECLSRTMSEHFVRAWVLAERVDIEQQCDPVDDILDICRDKASVGELRLVKVAMVVVAKQSVENASGWMRIGANCWA